ncbi:MAG: hypothetical protein JWM05_3375 [Acidimicrobiales bacterium]|nr:hypothetical protein [Acidimicrobiales bacterium]
MTAPRKFFFVHLQKTAGTALLHRLKRHFSEPAIYPDPTDGKLPDSVLVVDHLAERYRARGDEIEIVTGHFPLCATEVLGGGFTTLTVLRDPVERTLSFLRHHGALFPEYRGVPLEELYDDDIRFNGLIHNHMVKMFSLTPEEMIAEVSTMTRVTFTPERLERAKDALARIDVMGLQEQFEDFCDELTRRFGWQLGAPVHANVTKPVPVSDEFRARIAADNAADIELYAFAQSIYQDRQIGHKGHPIA